MRAIDGVTSLGPMSLAPGTAVAGCWIIVAGESTNETSTTA